MANLVLNIDYLTSSDFVTEEINGNQHIVSYQKDGHIIKPYPAPALPLAQRPILDTIGIKFFPNNLGFLRKVDENGNDIPVLHKQIYIVFNCLQNDNNNNYKFGNTPGGNGLYANRHFTSGTKQIGCLFGKNDTKTFNQFAFGTGASGFVTKLNSTNRINLGLSSNCNPINEFRIVCLNVPNTEQTCFYLGAGSNTPVGPAWRSLNGYVKAVKAFDEMLTGTEQEDFLQELRTTYAA